MSQPPPPADNEQRNIIDKLAAFVARNGPQAEEMTRRKQVNNPKFAFLYGGPHLAYYQFRVATEQALMRKHAMQQQSGQGFYPPHSSFGNAPPQAAFNAPPPQTSFNAPPPQTSFSAPPPQQTFGNVPPPMPPQQPFASSSVTNSTDAAEMAKLQKQVAESEQNLKAQRQALNKQIEVEVQRMLMSEEESRVMRLASSCRIDIASLNHTVQPLQQSCSKEAVSNARQWLLNNTIDAEQQRTVLEYLRLIFLRFDTNNNYRLHLLYLVNDWAHNLSRRQQHDALRLLSTFASQLYSVLHNRCIDDASMTEKLTKLQSLWQSSQFFDDNAYKRMHDPAATYAELMANLSQMYATKAREIEAKHNATYENYARQHNEYAAHVQAQMQNMQQPPKQRPMPLIPPGGVLVQAPGQEARPYARGERPQMGASGGGVVSRAPPPGSKSLTDDDLKPIAPYYDLPAALMVPLVGLADSGMEPLDPEALRLPPPMPPSEKLITAMEHFYSAPTHERPRDSEGWEKLGLYEFFRDKQRALAERKRQSEAADDDVDGRPITPGDEKDARPRERKRKSKWDT